MSNEVDKKEIIITCGCTELKHLFRITKYGHEPEAYVTMVMNHYLPLWKRVKLAFLYVFKKAPCDGYDEVVMDKESRDKLKRFLEEN
jgi:hypothetical protein